MAILETLKHGPKPGTPGGSGGINYLKGMDEVMRNLNIELGKIKEGSVRGLVEAAAFIRRKTESSYPLTPVDLGNLRSSWFITTASKKKANDEWNKGFRKTKPGTKKVKDADLAANHTSVITAAQGELSALNTKDKQFVMMGYSANYAGFVHEFVGDVNWSRDNSGAKWLQSHVYRNSKKIVEIVRDNAKVK